MENGAKYKKVIRKRFLSAFLNYSHQIDFSYSVNTIQKTQRIIKNALVFNNEDKNT